MQNYDFDSGRNHIGQRTEQDNKVFFLLDKCGKLLKGRQFEVFQLIRQGATYEQIALILGISESNVRTHAERYRKNIRKRYNSINLNNHTMADYLNGRDNGQNC